MKKRDKFAIVMLTIFTLGFCWLHWKIQANKYKKLASIDKEDIKLPSVIKIDNLISLLGNKDNIKGSRSTISNLIIEINNKDNVNVDEIKQLKYVSGVMISSQKITLIVGDYASKISNELIKKLK
ncbi:PTS sugar transporter subunit IIA [Mycoplasma sp. Mirounga ES2805-ORL]|uniref:PTS sugar transporter subunit IIA n=1 Tax=Mycoplasma sp. Mirounga ES2805-ORL TaxID=754514 RepID=UPI00197C7461|nr:PTS sugar transporter subunit IIA [Mycoplasma sp. Mirounga ES2805-ORL]QSF13753.1 PTS sugar transporter subunit IIA [Mycoplasma sp. Mirounga ES2805-ORL]